METGSTPPPLVRKGVTIKSPRLQIHTGERMEHGAIGKSAGLDAPGQARVPHGAGGAHHGVGAGRTIVVVIRRFHHAAHADNREIQPESFWATVCRTISSNAESSVTRA